MKEHEILSVIKSVIGDKYIGDDCAHLKDLGIVVSQDSLIEDVHFDLKYTTPYQLGYKSVMVNISDIAASGGVPKYLTIALSLPKNVSKEFIKEFYEGAKFGADGVEIVGGDITGADKIMVSVTAIGSTIGRNISSRSGAKEGYVVVVGGVHGSSAGGLKLLQRGESEPQNLIDAHLMPRAQVDFASAISSNLKDIYAMMDSSDGLADALFKIAQQSEVTITVDFDKITYDKELKEIFPDEYKDMILFGGEDYKIVASLPEIFAQKLEGAVIIGKVEKQVESIPVKIIYNGEVMNLTGLEKCFNHFE